ncbi:MAG: 1-deoxy-D-xylulose-5-phosphate reductoisomerase [Candidatus Midichloriaceae bacterium]|jgi:1-deoxy-D-xylulose-5-phosphate reductoisomerase|nr:1-deoxy-D-xylulose-5-phosphate reductoisomerase [Candidatus Midichloriaceae bacterium]
MKKVINILGATGSIGDSGFSVIREHPDKYEVGVIVAGSDVRKLIKLALEFKPKAVAIFDSSKYSELKEAFSGGGVQIFSGEAGVIEAASISADITLSAISGFAALKPTLAAIENSKTIALANKESLVCAGNLVLEKAKAYNTKLIPVDSEHNALFQVFESDNADKVKSITITASGGAFRNLTLKEMEDVTPQMALKHPNWSMGPKITVDSATLANKGLEYIEACVLFPVSDGQVKVLIHAESIIHGMVSYKDGSVLAHLAQPDMRVPIAYSFAHPERLEVSHKGLDLAQIGKLSFATPDDSRFPMLKLAQDCMAAGQDARVAFNAVNEVAVSYFLDNKIKFLDINKLTSFCVNSRKSASFRDAEDICEYDAYIRTLASEKILSL